MKGTGLSVLCIGMMAVTAAGCGATAERSAPTASLATTPNRNLAAAVPGTATAYAWSQPQETPTPYPWRSQPLSPEALALEATLQARTGPKFGSTWSTYQNDTFRFLFNFPWDATLQSQSPNSARIYFTFTPGTNLAEKYMDINVQQGVRPCVSPDAFILETSRTIQIKGNSFLEEQGSDHAAGNIYDVNSYLLTKDSLCISLTFVLHSHDAQSFVPPLPEFDMKAESLVFSVVMSTFETW